MRTRTSAERRPAISSRKEKYFGELHIKKKTQQKTLAASLTAKAWLLKLDCDALSGFRDEKQGEVPSQRGKNIWPGATPIIGERRGKCPLWHHDTSNFPNCPFKLAKAKAGESFPHFSQAIETCFPLSHADLCIPNTGAEKHFGEERGRLSGGELFCAKSQIVLIQRWQRQDRTGHIPCTDKTAKQSSHGRLTLRVTLTRDSLVRGENLAITRQAARAAVWLSATHGGHGVRRSLFACSSMNVFDLYIPLPPPPTPSCFWL